MIDYHYYRKAKLIFLICFTFYWLFTFYPSAQSNPATSWIFNRANACLNPDNLSHIAANNQCIAIQTYTGKHLPKQHSILVVFIHGDGVPGGGPSDYLKYQATKFVTDNVISVVMIRPGYYDSYGHYSTGNSHAFDCHGYPCDGYRKDTVATLVGAIQQLKNYYQPRAIILVGHSGGAMMSAIILGKYPDLANAAVLASMVPNVHAWAKKHGWGSWPNSLSPSDFQQSLRKDTIVRVISGNNDKNTYPSMSKSYVDALQKIGIDAKFIVVAGGDHNSVVLTKTKQFDQAIERLIKHFS